MSTTGLRVRDERPRPATADGTAGIGPASPRRLRDRKLFILGLQILFAAFVAGTWQGIVEAGWVDPLFVSKPFDIVQALYNLLVHGALAGDLATTIYETAVGFAISVVAGILSALVLLELPILQRTMSPFITAANNLPRLALAPLFVLWFGIGATTRIVLIVSLVYFIILINTYAGLQSTERDHLMLARVVGASRWQTFVRFRLPAALPTMFAGFQLGLTYAFLGAVIAEMISGGNGLGAELSTYTATFNTANVFADLLLMALVATALAGAMRVLERYALGWRRYELRGLTTSR